MTTKLFLIVAVAALAVALGGAGCEGGYHHHGCGGGGDDDYFPPPPQGQMTVICQPPRGNDHEASCNVGEVQTDWRVEGACGSTTWATAPCGAIEVTPTTPDGHRATVRGLHRGWTRLEARTATQTAAIWVQTYEWPTDDLVVCSEHRGRLANGSEFWLFGPDVWTIIVAPDVPDDAFIGGRPPQPPEGTIWKIIKARPTDPDVLQVEIVDKATGEYRFSPIHRGREPGTTDRGGVELHVRDRMWGPSTIIIPHPTPD